MDTRYKSSNDDLYSFAELIYSPDKQEILKAKLLSKGIICNHQNGISVLSIASKEYYEIDAFEQRISFLTGTQKYCIIVPTKCIAGQTFLNNLSKEQYENIKGIGISEQIFSLDKIQEAIEEANLLSYQYFISGEKICSHDLKENFKKGDEFVKHIIGNYFKGKFFNGTIQKEIEKLASENCINIKHAFTIYNFITHYNNSYEAQGQDTIYGFNELTKLFSDFKSMCRYLDKTSSTETGTRMKESRTINFSQILNYIDNNFCDDITIQDISEKYYINPSYVSQLFRKELGITFTDYLVKKRMEFARELMKDESIKTVDIYQKCGYNDYFYFIRCFKKYFGISPGQYRNS